MPHHAEIFMPTLSAVDLDIEGGAAPAAADLRAALGDLDPAAFGGAAGEELTMAKRRLGEMASAMLPGGKTAVSAKLAILNAPWRNFPQGALAYVRGSTAYLAEGTRADPASGWVMLQRDFVALERPEIAAQKVFDGDANTELETVFQMADKAKAALPKEFGAMVDVTKGFISLFGGGGPSDVEVVVKAMQAAVNAAVTALETFISAEKVNDIRAGVNGAYRCLQETASNAKNAGTLDKQTALAHKAIDDMKGYIKDLREALDRLTMITVPNDAVADLRARTKAAILFAHGAGALFLMHKLTIQFHAFLAMQARDTADSANHRVLADFAYTAFKIDVLGDDRAITPGRFSGDLVTGSFLLAYQQMYYALGRDRAALMIFVMIRPPAVTIFDLEGPRTFSESEWFQALREAGAAEPLLADGHRRLADQKAFYASARATDFLSKEKLFENRKALDSYWNIVLEWNTALTDWNALLTTSASALAAR